MNPGERAKEGATAAPNRGYSATNPMATPKKASTLAQLQALVTALPALCPGVTFTLSGRTYTVAQAAALAGDMIAAEARVTAAQAVLRGALIKREQVIGANGPLVHDLRSMLRLRFNGSPGLLAELAISPKKTRGPLTTQVRLEKQAKTAATRVARGTKSKKQKSKIFGSVTGVTITPTVRPKK
jgi:hypothetical protein